MNTNLQEAIFQTLDELDKEETLNSDDFSTSHFKYDHNFLSNLQERILVLFEGLQSPNINNVEKKLDLTINFLEYLLADIDKRLNG